MMRLRDRVLQVLLIASVMVQAGALVPPVGLATAQQLALCTTNTALPDAIKIALPDSDPATAPSTWLGAFEGVWDGDLPSRLVVERLNGAKAHIVYTWGDEPTGSFKAGFRRFTADLLADGSIQWGPATDHFAFRLSGDTASGELTRQSRVFRATMQRCTMTTPAESPDLMAVPIPTQPVIEDSLVGPGVVTVATCPTGRISGGFVDEGYLFKVTGRCQDGQNFASSGTAQIPDLRLGDGEARVEYKAVTGRERLRLRVGFRLQPVSGNAIGYAARIEPGRGAVDLVKQTAPDQFFILDERNDLAARLATDDWSTIAIRTRGPNLWVLLNDEPVLAAYDTTFDSGGVNFGFIRLGNLDDSAESGVVLRNFKFSPLAQ